MAQNYAICVRTEKRALCKSPYRGIAKSAYYLCTAMCVTNLNCILPCRSGQALRSKDPAAGPISLNEAVNHLRIPSLSPSASGRSAKTYPAFSASVKFPPYRMSAPALPLLAKWFEVTQCDSKKVWLQTFLGSAKPLEPVSDRLLFLGADFQHGKQLFHNLRRNRPDIQRLNKRKHLLLSLLRAPIYPHGCG